MLINVNYQAIRLFNEDQQLLTLPGFPNRRTLEFLNAHDVIFYYKLLCGIKIKSIYAD